MHAALGASDGRGCGPWPRSGWPVGAAVVLWAGYGPGTQVDGEGVLGEPTARGEGACTLVMISAPARSNVSAARLRRRPRHPRPPTAPAPGPPERPGRRRPARRRPRVAGGAAGHRQPHSFSMKRSAPPWSHGHHHGHLTSWSQRQAALPTIVSWEPTKRVPPAMSSPRGLLCLPK